MRIKRGLIIEGFKIPQCPRFGKFFHTLNMIKNKYVFVAAEGLLVQ